MSFYIKYLELPYPEIPRPVNGYDLRDNGFVGEYEWYAKLADSMAFEEIYDLFVACHDYGFKNCNDFCSALVAIHFRRAEKKNGIQGI